MWLASLDPGLSPVVPLWVTPGSFSFPRQSNCPVIMIGPGTGCAPFRAYLEERAGRGEGGEGIILPPQTVFSQPLHSLQTICCSLVAVLQEPITSSGTSGPQ